MPRVKLFSEEEVLNKAMELFWKKGFHATSIQDLVDHLGINRASLYSTFGGKNELFDKAFLHYRTLNRMGLSRFFDSQTSVKKGFRSLFEKAIDESIADKDKKGCFVINCTTELVPGDEAIEDIIHENVNLIEGLFYSFLISGEKTGEIPKGKDLKTIANFLLTLYNGIMVRAKIRPNRKKLLASVDAALILLD